MASDAQTLYAIGSKLCEEGKYAESLEALMAALRSNPGYVEAYNTLGVCYLALARSDRTRDDSDLIKQATEAFNYALTFDPRFYKAASNLALIHMLRGHHDAAIAACNQALDVLPSYHEALYVRGSARLALGEYALSVRDFEGALDSKPGDAQTLLGLAAALYLSGQASDAGEVYAQLAYSSPDRTSARLGVPEVDRALDLMELGAYEAMPSVRDEDLASLKVLEDLADEVTSGKAPFEVVTAEAAKAGRGGIVTSACLVKMTQSMAHFGKENPDKAFLLAMLGFQAAKGAERSFIAAWILQSIGKTALEAGRFDFAAGNFERAATGFRELGHDDLARKAETNRDKARAAQRRGSNG